MEDPLCELKIAKNLLRQKPEMKQVKEFSQYQQQPKALKDGERPDQTSAPGGFLTQKKSQGLFRIRTCRKYWVHRIISVFWKAM